MARRACRDLRTDTYITSIVLGWWLVRITDTTYINAQKNGIMVEIRVVIETSAGLRIGKELTMAKVLRPTKVPETKKRTVSSRKIISM